MKQAKAKLSAVFRFVGENRLTGSFKFEDGRVRSFQDGQPQPGCANATRKDGTDSAPKLIRQFRLSAQMTQQEFAKKFDIPLGTLRRWEQGVNAPRADRQFMSLLNHIQAAGLRL